MYLVPLAYLVGSRGATVPGCHMGWGCGWHAASPSLPLQHPLLWSPSSPSLKGGRVARNHTALRAAAFSFFLLFSLHGSVITPEVIVWWCHHNCFWSQGQHFLALSQGTRAPRFPPLVQLTMTTPNANYWKKILCIFSLKDVVALDPVVATEKSVAHLCSVFFFRRLINIFGFFPFYLLSQPWPLRAGFGPEARYLDWGPLPKVSYNPNVVIFLKQVLNWQF